MTNDIHAAAERWKRVRNGEEIKDVYGMMKPDWTPAQLSADCDACDLADAYVSLLDDTPITDEWLDQAGYLVTEDDDVLKRWLIVDHVMNIVLFRQTDHCAQSLVLYFSLVTFSKPTMRQLRALLLAMGVGG